MPNIATAPMQCEQSCQGTKPSWKITSCHAASTGVQNTAVHVGRTMISTVCHRHVQINGSAPRRSRCWKLQGSQCAKAVA